MRDWISRYVTQLFCPVRPGTVRFMFPLVLGTSVLLAATALTSVSYSYIRIAPSQTTLQSGDPFSIDIYANAHTAVNAVDISLAFSEKSVEIVGIDTGQSVITLWTEQPKVSGNVVTLRGGTFQRGFRGEHLIATVNAKAKQTGQAEFSINNLSLLAGDGRGTPVLTGKPEQSRASLVVLEAGEEQPSNLRADIQLHIVTDIDGDGKVTLRDISSFLVGWHSRSTVYDFNNDGRMTFRDFAIILAHSFFGPT